MVTGSLVFRINDRKVISVRHTFPLEVDSLNVFDVFIDWLDTEHPGAFDTIYRVEDGADICLTTPEAPDLLDDYIGEFEASRSQPFGGPGGAAKRLRVLFRWPRWCCDHGRAVGNRPIGSIIVTVLSQETIAHLPNPVQRSLHRSGLVDRPIPATVVVRQQGTIRTSPTGRWLRFVAREQYQMDPPGFVWQASLKSAGLTVGRATDSLDNGRGRMHVRILGLLNVVDATGPEMDQGSLMRWLNETMWFPAAWASEVISWKPIDENSAVGSVSSAGLSVRGEFRFDAEGLLVDFRADRYRDVKGAFEMTPWSTPLTEHARFDGIELPSYGAALWDLEDGNFEYIRIRATDVQYSS